MPQSALASTSRYECPSDSGPCRRIRAKNIVQLALCRTLNDPFACEHAPVPHVPQHLRGYGQQGCHLSKSCAWICPPVLPVHGDGELCCSCCNCPRSSRARLSSEHMSSSQSRRECQHVRCRWCTVRCRQQFIRLVGMSSVPLCPSNNGGVASAMVAGCRGFLLCGLCQKPEAPWYDCACSAQHTCFS